MLLTAFLLLGGCLQGFSQHLQKNNALSEEKYRIGISNDSFIPSSKSDFNQLSGSKFRGKYFGIIQFYKIPGDDQRKAWATNGLVLTDYLPGNAYYAVIDESFPFSEVAPFVRSVISADKRFKMENSLFKNGVSKNMRTGDGLLKMIISYYAGLPSADVITDLRNRGVHVENHREYSQQLDVTFNSSDLETITQLPYVQYLGPQAENPVNETEDHNNSSGRTNYVNTGFGGLNYNGAGTVIGVGEDGTVNSSKNVKGRLNEMMSGSVSAHKVGVMNYMAGAGNLDPIDRNNAWGADVLSLPVSPDYATLYTTHNLRYTNHSYGFPIGGGYDLSARNHDLRIAALPNHLVIYSAGNSGTSLGYAPYNLTGWANITGLVKHNKNQLSVGALTPVDVLTDFSSRGPMYDGRIIPQLVIEGAGGTSNAAPKTTGIMGILAQIFKDKNSGAEPPSSLLRAILMNTADDLEQPGPDFKTGYGRPNVRRAYHTINDNRHLVGSVSNENTVYHDITVPAQTKQMRVMIVWPDPAAAVNANPAIVNNLNLSAKSPSNISYNPWILDHSASLTSITANATRGIDSINTVEQITVDSPEAGTWAIEVKGHHVPSGPQTYYLTYEFLSDELHMAFPLADQRLIPGETYNLRWDSYGEEGTFSLAYELNNSGNWITIISNQNAASRVYSWLAPNPGSGINTIKFRIKRGELTAFSGINYIGGVPENFRVLRSCDDTVVLKWSPVENADSYRVYRLGDKYMEEVVTGITFSGASATLSGQNSTESEFYAVSAVTGANEGSRTMTIEKSAGDYMCDGIAWTGTVSTDWFDPGNWGSGAVPTPQDIIVIPSSPSNQPLIAGSSAACGRITIENGATLSMNASATDTLFVSGDWYNNGTFNRGIGYVNFNDTIPYVEIGGSSETHFYKLKINTGARNRIVEATAVIKLLAPTDPLEIASGTFKLSSASTITPFHTYANANLSAKKGLWNNGGTINYGNLIWNLDGGLFRSSSGTTTIGNVSGVYVNYLNNGNMVIDGGSVSISGRLSPNGGASTIQYTQTGGTLTVNTAGSTSTTTAPFQINSTGTFKMSGGTIVIQRSSGNTADYINLATNYVVSGGTVQIGNASTPASQTIRINSSVPINNLTISTTNSPTARLITNNLIIKNNLTIAGGTFETNNLNVSLGGNLLNNGTLTGGRSVFTAHGAETQKISGNNPITLRGLALNNKAGLELSGTNALYIDSVLTFVNGKVSTLASKIIIRDNAVIEGAGPASFIDGTCQKTGDDAFTFPIGSGLVYAPVSISKPDLTTDHFTASYFPSNPSPTYSHLSVLTPLGTVSGQEYWIVNRTGGDSKVAVTLTWDPSRSEPITSLTELLIARWNGTQWVSEGNAGTTGDISAGSVVSNLITGFSPFTLGSSSTTLPVDLISFSAIPDKNNVLLKWSVAGDRSVFTIERSPDGKSWTTVTELNDRVNNRATRNYHAMDLSPLKGRSYYRLKISEPGSPDTYSKLASVYIERSSEIYALLYPNPTSGIVYLVTSEKQSSLEIFSAQGVPVAISQDAEALDVSRLSPGQYLVRIVFDNNKVITKTLVIQK